VSESLRVLLVEDDQLLRQILEQYLKRMGHTVYSAWTVEGAIKSLRVEQVDIVLLDILLNGSGEMGGLRVAGRTPRDIPIVVISGGDESRIRAEAARNPLTGVVHWLTKPFRFEQLTELFDTLTV
jgi:DNA-binding response OmpR family regulator